MGSDLYKRKSEGTNDEIIVRYSNTKHPQPTQEMRLSAEKSNCKGDYGCCGRLP
jgi:hypothetical protein